MRNRMWRLGLVGATGTSFSLFEHPKLPFKLLRVEAEETHKPNIDPKIVDLTKPLDLSCRQLDTDQCILVVGTTGSGKSSTIAKVTGQKVRVGSSASSVTRHCQLYEKNDHDNTAVWVDTVGYDDTANLEDGETFKEVLRYIAEQRLLKIKAIVWTVLPQERKDARLQRQADFINKFRDGDIWPNVIILVKQPGSFNLGLAAQGAREAARQHCYRGEEENIQVLGCTYLDNTIPEEMLTKLRELDDEQRRKMLLLTDEEVVTQIEGSLGRIETPVQVVFEDSECPDCGVVGDKRLLSDYCHMGPMFRHPQLLRHYHPAGDLQPYHTLPIETFHPGVLRLEGGPHETCETVRNVMAALILPLGYLEPSTGVLSALLAGSTHMVCTKLHKPLQYLFTCCQRSQDSTGCKSAFACCKRPPGNSGCCYSYPCCQGGPQAGGCATRYACCDKEEGSIGCQVVCRKCGLEWGSPAGDCFKKEHNLRTRREQG